MRDQIERLLSYDEDRLYAEIAESLPSGASTEAPDAKAGRAWLERNRTKLRRTVCSSYAVQVYQSSPKIHERTLIVAAIADLIAGLCGTVPAVTVAVLLVKEGLDSLCS